MKIISRHGYLTFYPKKKDDLIRFARLYKTTFESENDFFTSFGLSLLPRYSIQGVDFGGLPAAVNFEGQHASEVLKANEYVPNIKTNFLVPLSVISSVISLSKTADYAIYNGVLIQPGSFLRTGERIVSYRGEIDLDWQKLYLTDWSET
jgi:hypothetical protein